MLGKDSKTLDNTNHGNKNQEKKLRKSSQGQEKGIMIKKTPSKLREPHKDMIQRTQVTIKKHVPVPYGTKKINQMTEIGHNKTP